MRVQGLIVCLAFLATAGIARAEESGPLDSGPAERPHQPGQSSIVELNALAGTFVGFRLKGIVHPARSWNLALELLDGARIVSPDGTVLRGEHGGGIRVELMASSYKRDAALLSPGVALLYLPRTAAIPSPIPSFAYAGRDPGLLLEPNLDFMVVHEFDRHFGVLVGLHGGAVLALDGHDGSGKSVSGAVRPDGALYVGARF